MSQRPTTLSENLLILRARLSEHLSPAEYRELAQAAMELDLHTQPAALREGVHTFSEQELKTMNAGGTISLPANIRYAAMPSPSPTGDEKDSVRVPVEFIEALVNHNDNARSFFQIAQRIATEFGTHELATNFGAFAETTHNMLKKYHMVTNQARAMVYSASLPSAAPREPQGKQPPAA